jgi:hypothetical protein
MPMMEANREPSWLENIPYNPALMAGLSILGTQPGGNWGPAGAQAMANTAKLGMARTEWERQQAQRALQQKVWGEAFPGGQANMQHPLLKGVPPELAATVYTQGPDEGLPLLGKLQLTMAEAREKMRLAEEQRRQMIQGFGTLFNGGGQAQPPAVSVPSAPAMPATAPTSVPGTVTGDIGQGAVSAPAAPAAAAPAAASTVWDDPDLRKAVIGNLYMGDTKGAMGAIEKAISDQRALAQVGPRKLAEKQAEELAAKPQARAALASTLDSLNRMEAEAKAIQSDPALSGITGVYGQFPDWLGGKSADVRARLHSLINQTGLATMQALKSGAQHGNSGFRITNQKEFEALQSTLAGLDTKQSTESMKRALQQIIDFSAKSRSHLQGSWKETYGQDYEEPGGGQPVQTVYPTRLQRPAPPKPGQVIDGYRYKGMGDPAKQSSWVKVE